MRRIKLNIVKRNGRKAVKSGFNCHACFWKNWKTGEIERRLTRVFPSVHGGVTGMNYKFNYRKSYRLIGDASYYPLQFTLAY